MKENPQAEKLTKDNHPKKSFSGIFLNIIILLLAVIVIYMSYSLYLKLDKGGKPEAHLNNKSKSRILQVEVLNGCGISGVADRITDYLRQHNFDVVQIGNYISYDVEKSIVIDRTGNMSNAFKVADTLGISRNNVIQQVNSNYFLDVSLIIGKDFNNLKPYQ